MRKLFTLAAALLASFSLWADQTTLIDGVTLPDIPASSLDMATQEFKTADENGWIVIEPNGEIRNASVSWFTAMAWNTTSVTISDVSSFTAPFTTLSNVSCTTVRKTERTKAIRFTGASDFAVLGSSTGSRNLIVALYSYDGTTQTAVESKSTGNEYNEMLFTDLSLTTDYIAYMYCDVNSNAVVAEIAIKKPTCTSPELTLRGDTTIYVEDGNTIDLQTAHIGTGGLQVAVKKDGAEAVPDVDYTLTMAKNFKALTKGVFEITVKHVASGEYCDEEATVTITALEKDPVTECTITGPTTAVIGQKIKLIGSTDVPATNVWWTDQYGATLGNKDTLEYTCNAKGTLKFNFWAENAFNTEPAISADHEVVVTKLCGELIKAVYDPDTKTSTVTGVIGGTADRNTQENGKLGSNGHYYGAVLASGSLMAGDVVTVKASALNGGNTATLFADKGETELGSAAFDETTLTAVITLTKSASAVYLYRKDSGCNPNIESISVSRSCEDSNDATIHSLTVNGNEVAENDGLFEYTLSASYEEPTVTIAFEIHPLATIKYGLSNPYEMTTPDLGDSRGQAFTIIAEDGTEKTYTVQIYKSASLSNDATLKELSVEGFNLNVEFDPEVVEYSIFKDYTAEYPADSLITATPNDANAKSVNITFNEGVFTIVVTAEDEATTKTYTITVNNRLARKDLLRVAFSNGAIGFVSGYTIRVPYIAGEEVPTFASATFWNPEGTATAEMLGEQLKVTGVDGVYNLYTIEPVAVSPMAANYEEITFDTVPNYIFTIYGWDAEKGVKFSKDAEEASNHRISEGKDRIYLALPAAKELILTSGSGAERPVTITVNGVASSVTKTAKKNETITIELDGTMNNLVSIESNGSNGDGGFTKMQLVEIPTAIDNTDAEVKAVKIIRDGQLFIRRDGKVYNAQGVIVK